MSWGVCWLQELDMEMGGVLKARLLDKHMGADERVYVFPCLKSCFKFVCWVRGRIGEAGLLVAASE